VAASAQLEQLLALTADADSVELKLTVPDSERRSTVTALAMDPLNAISVRSTSSTPPISPSTSTALSFALAGSSSEQTTPW
jgi:hypothetical protein